MKKIIFFLMGLLWLNGKVYSQTELITFPTEGSVFQANSLGNYNLTFGGQVKTTLPMFYMIEKKTGNGKNDWTTMAIDINLNPNFNSVTGGIGRGIFALTNNNTNLTKGWYRICIYRKWSNWFGLNTVRSVKHTVQFGVGDVYFIAGQSNASGYGGASYEIQGNAGDANNDNTVSSILNSTNENPMARILNSKGSEQMLTPGLNNPQKEINAAIPYKVGFSEFKNGTILNPNENSSLIERPCIYPNGYNSWYWAPLAHKIANPNNSHKFSGTPTLWFNVASPSTSLQDYGGDAVNIWNINPTLNSGSRSSFLSRPFNQTLMGKFKQTLEIYAGPFGAKGVLWHQGETDHEAIMDNNSYVSAGGYQNSLTNIINKSREYATGSSSNTSLNWFVAKTSLYPKSSSISNSSFSSGINISGIPNNGSYKGNQTDKLYTSSALRDNQTSTLTNVFEGPNTDDINSSNSSIQRSSHYFVHFSGSSLQKAADDWYAKLNQTTNSLPPTVPLKIIQIVKNSATSYTLTVDNSIESTEFVWLVDGYGLNNWYSRGTSNTITFNNVQPDYFLHGYAKKNGRWHAIMPFMVPGGSIETKKLVLSENNLPAPTQGGTLITKVTAVDTEWEIQSGYPTWMTVSYDQDETVLNVNVSANSSSTARIGVVQLLESGGGLGASFTVTQSGSSSLTTSLTSLNPTNSSSEWQGYGTARFNGTSIDGNTINIGGTLYTQGIGTHANSRIVYNLNNAYSTFSCKFGMDQESNCCDGATFTIKADGQTIYGPVTKVWGQVATVVSGLSVVGKTTLELITDQISNNYADHTDWADVYLQSGGGGCGTPPIAPTSVSASPSSISSGGSSTLSASCAYGTVTWSTGATGGSISVSPGVTTNYTVKCVSAGCPDSPVVGVTVTVSNSPCSVVEDNLNMGTWTESNHPLIVRYFNNQYWLTQRIGTNPEKFLVRGSNMLTRSDVNLINNTYANLTSCFAWQNSNYGGLAVPNTTQFPTPSGFTLAYEPDNTPFYTANGSCGLTSPTNVAASPGSISSGQSSTLSATCANGTRLWSTGATSATIVVNPTSTTTYTVKCTQAGCPDSPISSVTVQVGPCAALSHNLVMGTWNETGSQLVAKNYHNQWWLVQRIGTSPEKFLVRGAEMLSRNDVALVNGTYSNLVGCFSWPYSSYGGLATPNSTTFPTPSGWQYGTEPDGTPFYTSTGGARQSSDIITIEETIPRFISVYPNPNQGAFVVKVYLESESSLDIDLINSSGKIYQSIKYNGVEGQNEIPFTTENISGGNYLIRVKTKDKVQSTTVVIK